MKNVLECDLKLEHKALADLREGVAYRESVRDYASRDLPKAILIIEEGHEDVLEAKFEMTRQMGVENYLQLNSAAAPEQHG